MNDGADFWRYTIGVNTLPGNSREKRPILNEWKSWQNKPIPEELYRHWKWNDKHKEGIHIIPGNILHNSEKKKEALKLVALDFDERGPLDEFVTICGYTTLDQLAQDMIVEQHLDDPNKAHVYFYTRISFPKQSRDNNLAVEIKGEGSHGVMCVSPSIHKNGYPYQIIGTKEPKEYNGELLERLKDMFAKHDVQYADNGVIKKYNYNGNGNGNGRSHKYKYNASRILIDTDDDVYEGARNPNLHAYACHIIRTHLDDKTIGKIKQMVVDTNQKRCKPPLPELEAEQVWNSAEEFISKEMKKQKLEQKPKKNPVKKYSQNCKGILYESVVIGEKSKFVYLRDKKPQFVDEVQRVNDVLVPNDTIDTQNPIPFVFESDEDLEQCLEEATKETLETLFSKLESINRKYVDVEAHYHVLFTANMIWTWLQDKFGYTHYSIIVGDNGSGKNSQLLVFRYMGYRVFYAVSASAANYYTRMGNVEEGQITIAEDEADDVAKDREKRNVYKSGYCSGGTVPKVDLEGGRKSEDWLTYGQKWAAMEELPTDKQMKGILDRSFVFKFVSGNPQYNIKDVIKPAGDPKFKPLYDELIKTRKVLFCWRMLHYDDAILDVELNVKNRTAELTKPLIRLFQNSPVALQRIMDSLIKFMSERNEIKKNSFESKLYEVVKFLKDERKQRLESSGLTDDEKMLGELTFTNPALLNMAKEMMECTETDKTGLYWSSLLGTTVSQSKITSVAKSKLKAEPCAKKIDGKTVRCLKFEEKFLKRIESIYDMPDKIEIVFQKQKQKQVTPVTPVTP